MPPSPESSPLLDAASPAPEPSPASDEPTREPLAIEDWLTVLAMAALALITFANVLVRYFTDSSLAWAEEFSVFLMIVLSLVGGVMIAAMSRAGYPASFSASVVGAAAATDILIPPSVAFIVYSVLVPGASVPALFAAGMIPGLMAGVALIVPAVWLARRHGMGALEATMPRPAFWKSLRQAMWGLAAPVLILGGMRAGWFTSTEAAVVAVFYGLFAACASTARSGCATCS